MNDLHISPRTDELSSRVTKKRGSHPGTTRRTAIYSVLILVIWCGLAIGGYALYDDTKLALQAQISELDKQLEELRVSLRKLEDAARVY